MKTYRISYTLYVDIDAENEEEALDAANELLYEDMSCLYQDCKEIEEL